MAASELEEQKKLLLPILQRAEEIQAVEPRMAYYCRLYAIKKGLEIPKPAKEIAGLIKATFSQCEKDKPLVKPNEDTDRLYCENFALTVFRRADKVDRAGKADMNTCKAFYAAAIFLQVLEQFLEHGQDMDDFAPDLLEKIRYALWRAAEIRRALREGRQPAPPPEAGSSAPDGAADGPAGDLFAGPAYQQSQPDQTDYSQQQQQQGPAAGTLDSITSSTDDLMALPRPPSTVPPAGSTGLVAPAAAAGPRFRPGSRVWVGPVAPGSQPGAPPEEGTVGMMLAPTGGPGGQALYKVALRERLEEVPDSLLAPAVPVGGRLLFVPGIGQPPQLASIIAINRDQWPVTYLLQLDGGPTLDTDGGHLTLLAPGDQLAHSSGGSSGGQQQATACDTRQAPGSPAHLLISGYPAVGGVGAGITAPPLADHNTAAAAAAAAHQQHQQQPAVSRPAAPPARPAAVQPPPSPPAAHQPPPSSGYPAYLPAGTSHPPAAQRPAASAPAAAPAYGGGAAAAAAAGNGWFFPAPGGYQPSPSSISEAQKYAKYAASSLAFDDVAGSIKYLTDALRLLTTPPSK